jgi:hypothetical protein
MKTLQKGRFRAMVLVFASISLLGSLVSVNACRMSQFGFTGLSGLVVTPGNPVMAGGTQLQLTATGVYSTSSITEDLTMFSTWVASDPTVTVSASGVVTAPEVAAPITCVITATEPGGKSGSVLLTIKNAQLTSIDVSPPSADIDGGTAADLTATGTFISSSETFTQDISSTATWTTSDEAVATVDSGKVVGVSGGTATITASWENIVSNEAAISVSGRRLLSLDINPKDITIQRMAAAFYTATGLFDDGSTKDLTRAVTWTSSDTLTARIGSYSETGGGMTIITIHVPGTVTITATLGSISATTTLTASELAPY